MAAISRYFRLLRTPPVPDNPRQTMATETIAPYREEIVLRYRICDVHLLLIRHLCHWCISATHQQPPDGSLGRFYEFLDLPNPATIDPTSRPDKTESLGCHGRKSQRYWRPGGGTGRVRRVADEGLQGFVGAFRPGRQRELPILKPAVAGFPNAGKIVLGMMEFVRMRAALLEPEFERKATKDKKDWPDNWTKTANSMPSLLSAAVCKALPTEASEEVSRL
ncbi:hypothetical protein ColTof4_14368 [Colletotrichum tofieldiae]|nr:hypothetical protein ColTof3_14778 [Colletotrichum tofieldiae]GKT81945.1 hypothetical protein ColTof4_14368 [Colletotrichum tofieldiae]